MREKGDDQRRRGQQQQTRDGQDAALRARDEYRDVPSRAQDGHHDGVDGKAACQHERDEAEIREIHRCPLSVLSPYDRRYSTKFVPSTIVSLTIVALFPLLSSRGSAYASPLQTAFTCDTS